MIESSEEYTKAIVADARRIHVKAVVDVEDPDLVWGPLTAVEQEPGISKILQLRNKKFETTANYASMEPNRWILDGSYINRPENSAALGWEAGLTGALLSGPDGAFAVPQWAKMEFSNVGVLQACTIAFSDAPEDGTAADFTVMISSEGMVYHTKTVTGNTKALYVVRGFRVNNPDTIRVVVTRWSLPGRRMRMLEIVPGIYEVWTGDEMCGFEVKMQADPSCQTLPYGTAAIKFSNEDRRFDPRTKDGVFLMLEDRQGIDLYMGPEMSNGRPDYKPLGRFYQANGGWKTGDNSMTMGWSLVDIIGLLANRTYFGGTPTTLGGWISALTGQLGVNFKSWFVIEPGYAGLPVSVDTTGEINSLSGLSCGAILRLVCMATGTWPHADQTTGRLFIGPLPSGGNKVTLDNLNKYPTMLANNDAAYITVNDYTTMGNAPSCGNTVETSNPFVKDAPAAARSLLQWYGGDKFELTGRGDPASEIGDVDIIWLAEGNATSARRVKQELTISNGVLKNCKSSFVRGNGLFLFTNRRKFLSSGSWTVPDGVWQIRVFLVGHGSDGEHGDGGAWVNFHDKNTDYSNAEGKDGKDGSGGRIWDGVLDVNPGQVIQISVGWNTTLWHSSSANGRTYPNGYADVATGEVYGRSGVNDPKPGSGDGGKGGKKGKNGSFFQQGHWYYDDGYVPPGSAPNVGPAWGVDASYDAPGHWEHETVIEYEPTSGTAGSKGASGCAIIYWEMPEVIDEDDDT